ERYLFASTQPYRVGRGGTSLLFLLYSLKNFTIHKSRNNFKIKIEELVDSIVEYSSIKLNPERPSFTFDSEFVSFILSNNSDDDIKFGEKYIIGFKDADGNWYELPQTGICDDIGIELKPTGNYTFEAALHPRLNNNKPGIYRLYKQIRLGNNKKYVWLMTEFTLE
ncbi:MAG: hypothetical protein HDS13_00435, partial [Bacteroides sp.]|nr:hypothetical protein [Bacteroides sp.]